MFCIQITEAYVLFFRLCSTFSCFLFVCCCSLFTFFLYRLPSALKVSFILILDFGSCLLEFTRSTGKLYIYTCKCVCVWKSVKYFPKRKHFREMHLCVYKYLFLPHFNIWQIQHWFQPQTIFFFIKHTITTHLQKMRGIDGKMVSYTSISFALYIHILSLQYVSHRSQLFYRNFFN